MFENLVNQECRETKMAIGKNIKGFENLVNQECRETHHCIVALALQFENLVNQECRETYSLAILNHLSFENLVNQECRTLNKYICNQMHGKTYKSTKTKIWRVLPNPSKRILKRERPPCNEPILSRKKSKVNTTL